MRIWLKNTLYLIAAIWFSAAHAGSYEDFFIAVKQDNARNVAALLQRGFDPNTLDPKGLHALWIAVTEPAPKVANTLIGWPKTNVDWRNAKDESPLMLACLKGETEMAKRLVARGADVNKTGWTPLHYAATNGHVAIMELLLENHAYIDAESPNGTTPLMMAAHYGSLAAVKLLLDAGADPRPKNQLGLTAIDFANGASRTEAAEAIAITIRNKVGRGKW
ncbi:MAG: ankyrin repeat domain-containing protein [Pseudomonadota bacterium]